LLTDVDQQNTYLVTLEFLESWDSFEWLISINQYSASSKWIGSRKVADDGSMRDQSLTVPQMQLVSRRLKDKAVGSINAQVESYLVRRAWAGRCNAASKARLY
jgi:hypothetical protein